MRFLATFIHMSIFWLLLSGMFTTIHIILGLISCLFVSRLLYKNSCHSFNLRKFLKTTGRFILYLPWLIKEIITANIDIVYRTLHPDMPIKPQIIRIRPKLKSDFSKLVLANSITLTPGTVTIKADDEDFIVHAIADKPATGLSEGEMQKRVRDFDI